MVAFQADKVEKHDIITVLAVSLYPTILNAFVRFWNRRL